MMRNILALTGNDLLIAFKNKTIYLILFIPFFVFMTLKFTDQTNVNMDQVKIGLMQNYAYPPQIMQSVKNAVTFPTVIWVDDESEGRHLLKEKKIDGLLLRNAEDPERLTLLTLKSESLPTLAIIESFTALQNGANGNRSNWITGIEPLYTGDAQRQTLPTWILMIVLLIGFIILPAQVAEEKEKKLILALLQTPIREAQWLIAKVLTGMVLMVIAALLLHLLGGFDVTNLFDYTAFIVVGGFCFSAYGILLGLLCRTQAGARTLGVVFYLPHLLPSALADFSQQLSAVAPWLPSYQFYEPLRKILLEGGQATQMPFAWSYLLFAGLLTFALSYLLMKHRWMMG